MAHENQHGSDRRGHIDSEAGLSPSEKERLRDLDFEQEQLRLLDEQEREGITLETFGTADKARAVLRDRHANYVEHMADTQGDIAADLPDGLVLEGDAVRVSAALLHERHSDGSVIEKPAVRFAVTRATTPGNFMIAYHYVELSEGKVAGSDQQAEPKYDFTSLEVEMVEGMLEQRRQDRENGFYPHLNPDLAGLSDPKTAMTLLPPPPSNL